MTSPEILDFFSDDPARESYLEKDFSSPESKQLDSGVSNTKRNFEKERRINSNMNDDFSSDDKVVWVTAIFVFFGIMVFLLGYWLGKTSVKDLFTREKALLAEKEEKLNQQKVENLALSSATSTDVPVIVQKKVETSQIEAPQTEITEENPPVKNSKVSLVSQGANSSSKVISFKEKEVKKDLKEVKNETVLKKEEKKVEIQQPQEEFVIQVSAHTSMEKARAIEEAMRKLGFNSYLVEATVGGVTYYRVRVGKFFSKKDAEAALAKIKASQYGKDGFLINLK
jgi:cell division septation protein DedD